MSFVEKITENSRKYLENCKKIFEEIEKDGSVVLYRDTDSVAYKKDTSIEVRSLIDGHIISKL
jgi:hypothetical protein